MLDDSLSMISREIGKSLLQIGGYAFYRCETLTDLTFAANAELCTEGVSGSEMVPRRSYGGA